MKIAVVGATGATGRYVVACALAQGHTVTAVARHPEQLAPAERLTFRRGDVLSPDGLADAFNGADAVISCIGPKTNLSPGTLLSAGTANIIGESKRAHVRRFVMQSGIGLSDGHELTVFGRLVIRTSGCILAAAVADKAAAEYMTQQSNLEWIVVRPVVLTDKPARGRYTAGPFARVAPLKPLSFADCADCLVRAATGATDWVSKIVNVGF